MLPVPNSILNTWRKFVFTAKSCIRSRASREPSLCVLVLHAPRYHCFVRDSALGARRSTKYSSKQDTKSIPRGTYILLELLSSILRFLFFLVCHPFFLGSKPLLSGVSEVNPSLEKGISVKLLMLLSLR